MPVRNAYDEVIAVAQVINKNPDIDNGQFTEKDEKVTHPVSQMKTSLTGCVRKYFQKRKESVARHSKHLLDKC
jgi:hypothetical protein